MDQTLMNSLHKLLNCEIGGLDRHVITTEYRTHAHCIHIFKNAFCRFCVVFSSPPQRPMTPDFDKDFYTRSYPLHYFLILILGKEPVFSLFNVEC